MAKNQTPFFATANDLVALLDSVSATYPLRFVSSGMFDTTVVRSFDAVPPMEAGACYLIIDRDLAIDVRSVAQRSGEVRYLVDQVANPQTVVLRVGGMSGAERLVAGQIGTASAEPESLAIYRLIAKAMRSQFEKIKSFYVGPEASQLLDIGMRLTPTEKSPTSYDLTRS